MKNRFLFFLTALLMFSLLVGSGCTAPAPHAADPEDTIRDFTGNPSAPVVFERSMTTVTGEGLDIYRVGRDMFAIETDTGTLVSASFLSIGPVTSGPFSKEQAEPVARAYAERHYPGFTERNMELTESRVLDHGAGGIEYSFTWNEQSLGISLGNYAHVSVNPDGKILSYIARDRPAPSVSPAKIPGRTANETAVAYVLSRAPIANITAIESSQQLQVMVENTSAVVWNVDLEIRFMAPYGLEDHRGGNVYVDAMDGTVVKYEPCM